MSYFNNDHLKISNIIIDFEENISSISNFNKLLSNINNLDEFNNLRNELCNQLNNIENETNILINTLKIIQFNIRKLYDDKAKIVYENEDLEIKLKARINDINILLKKNKEIENQINYKNQIIEEQNNHILDLIKTNKNNSKLIKDLKYQLHNKKNYNSKNNIKKADTSLKNEIINNDKIIHYKNFINMKKNFNKNIKNKDPTLTEENNKINIKNKLIGNYKKDSSENSFIKPKNISTIDNEKYIFKEDLEKNDEDNNLIKNKTTIDDSFLTFNHKKEASNNDKMSDNIKYNSNNQVINKNNKDKIFNKMSEDKIIKKLKRKGQSAKNIHKIKNKNFEFDIENNRLTKYFIFNLQREKILNNKNFIKFIKQKTPKYKN